MDFGAASAVGILGGLGEGGLAACETRAGQVCSGVVRLLRTAFPSQNMPRVLDLDPLLAAPRALAIASAKEVV